MHTSMPSRHGGVRLVPQQLVYSVAQLNRAIHGSIVRSVGSAGLVLVRGEVGSVRVSTLAPGRDMVFFTLREGEECLSCVSYGRSLHMLLTCDRQTGEVFEPARTIQEVLVPERRVICEGMIGTYTRKGMSLFQLNVHSVTDCGAGDRLRELRLLKDKLLKLGYFSEERKRPLPVNPQRVALVTSLKGAVIHDFLRNAEDRGLGFRLRLYPVRVQGEGAGLEMAQAIARAGREEGIEVVVLIRGGGSEDDLACFNDEALARAIFECPVPVLAGIGHEVDFSLADLTADVRASTPTKAAQMLWTPRQALEDEVREVADRARWAGLQLVARSSEAVRQTWQMLRVLSPQNRWLEQQRQVEEVRKRLVLAGKRLCDKAQQDVSQLGQACARSLTLAGSLASQEVATLSLQLRRAGTDLVHRQGLASDLCTRDLVRAGQVFVDRRARAVERLRLEVEAVSPLGPLKRGFALIQDSEGHVVRSVQDVQPGAQVHMAVEDGTIAATVTDTRPREI